MSTTATEEALGKVAFFAGLNRRDLRHLATLCVPKTFETGAVILREGALGLGLYLISKGRVEVFKTERGHRRKLAELGSGDVLGEMALIDDKPRSASAEALEPTSALLLSRDSFRIVVKKSPAVAWAMVPELAKRLREVEDRLVEVECQGEEAQVRNVERHAAGSTTTTEWHVPQALLAVAVKGAGGPWRVFKHSSRAFYDAMKFKTDSRPRQLLARLPHGALAVAVSSLTETGKVSLEMISAFFDHLDGRRKGGSAGG